MDIGSTYIVLIKNWKFPLKPYVTEYHLYHGVCQACDTRTTADLPKGVNSDLLGYHAKAIISALSGFFHNSKRDVQQIFKDIFHMEISLGLVSTTEKRVSHKLLLGELDLSSM